jgi:diguanylate cyclase (GGDEF)-like protein
VGDNAWPSETEILQYQRMASQLYLVSSGGAIAVLVLPHWRGTNSWGVAAVTLGMIISAVALRAYGRALSRMAVHLMPLPGMLFVSLGVWAVGPGGAGAIASFYTMLAMGAFTYLARRVGITYLVAAATLYGALLAHWHVRGWPAQVAVMFSTSLIASYTAGRLMRRIRELAWRDELTGLANRRAWYHELEVQIANARRRREPLTVAVIDLDNFKTVNDTLGHDAGDRLLRDVARFWDRHVRRGDTLARWGGDEFGLVLPACPVAEAFAIVERLRESVPGAQSFSAGVAAWHPDDTADEVVVRADRALYDAKRRGRAQTSIQSVASP